jgi:IS5 family transposase
MNQGKKGQQWCFGMKVHIGVDADSGPLHTMRGSAGNVDDVIEANDLPHGEEADAFGGATGYQGAIKRPDMHTDAKRYIAIRMGRRKLLDKNKLVDELAELLGCIKASIWARVEYPFRMIKQQWGRVKVCYRSLLAKNTAQLRTLCLRCRSWG